MKEHGPQAGTKPFEYPGASAVTLAADPYQALGGADALAVLTQWPEYENPDHARIKSLLRRPLILDGGNIMQG